MKLAILFVFLFGVHELQYAQTPDSNYYRRSPRLFDLVPTEQPTIKFPKRVASDLNSMVFVKGGVFTFGMAVACFSKASDTTLYFEQYPYRSFVQSFYMSDHEVTNSEYRAFVRWVQDSLHTTVPAQLKYRFTVEGNVKTVAVVPDSSVEIVGFYGQKLLDSPHFANEPVSGVTFYQAMAYCHWKTNRINELLTAEGKDWRVAFSLPTQKEWEYAALASPYDDELDIITERRYYPWTGWDLKDPKGHYRANFGAIYDENNVPIKTRTDDGFMSKSHVKSFPPNQLGIYDLAGNVAEWTREIPNPASDSIQQRAYDKQELQLAPEVRNSVMLNRFAPARVVKGGSYNNSPMYLLSGQSQLYNENKAHITVGFRMTMQVLNEE